MIKLSSGHEELQVLFVFIREDSWMVDRDPVCSQHERHAFQYYARQVRSHLEPDVFQRAPRRLLWVPVHLVIIGAAAYVQLWVSPSWYVCVLLAVLGGHSWGCLGFLAHEGLHHALVNNRTVEKLLGFLGFGIYCLSPTLWVAWHNQAHHANTSKPIEDPDNYCNIGIWRRRKQLRFFEKLAPGSGYKRSWAYLFTGFSMQAFLVLIFHSHRCNYYARISKKTVYAETVSCMVFWLAVLLLVGPWNFLFVHVLPLLVANALVMSYISTNHFLNSATHINDPLVNSLSVTNFWLVECIHLQFGYHVEHHIFPSMSACYAPRVRDVLVKLYGERYLSMPHAKALKFVLTRPKIRQGADMLINPHTNKVFQTLLPGNLSVTSLGHNEENCQILPKGSKKDALFCNERDKT